MRAFVYNMASREDVDAFHKAGPARSFWYTVSWAFLFQVYGIFWSKFGYKVLRVNVTNFQPGREIAKKRKI